MFGKEIYATRRAVLRQSLREGVVLLIGNDEAGINYADNTYPFRQDSTFLYYFGLSQPGLYAIIDAESGEDILFGDDASIDSIVWTGPQPTMRSLADSAAVASVGTVEALKEYLKKVMRAEKRMLYLPPYRPEHKLKILELLRIMPWEVRHSYELCHWVVKQRIYKSDDEIVEINRACLLTAEIHERVIRETRIGMRESDLAAIVCKMAQEHNFALAFPTIATVNGQTLHNHYHGNVIKEGDMLLLDAGVETEMGYAGDMSSTIPAGKRFTQRQRDVYDVAVAAHLAAVNALRPGVPFESIYDLAAETIMEGLQSLGLTKGNAAEAVRLGAHALFFPCGLGHMMGLDVHDMENLGEVYVGYDGRPKSTQFGRKSLRLARPLEPGFVITVEPGIYFIPELIDQWRSQRLFTDFINYDKVEAYKDFGGIRNEEDYYISRDGAILLGHKIPLTADEVEAARN
ncbi:MAG: aminopeptidase P N-terminal domain-containing protein [Tannerellaceae bacterium]|nr:aminopeptidase P N-terminal domain-containing protein [Tannerellaceae bacterium]